MKQSNKQIDTEERSKSLHDAAPYLTLSWQLISTIVLGAVLGYYLDKWNNTAPRFLIIMMIGFTLLAFANFLRTVIRLSKEEDRKDVLAKKMKAEKNRGDLDA